MNRFAHFEDELQKYIGVHISKEVLLGRNYFFVEDGRVKEDLCLSEIDDFELYDSLDYHKFYNTVDFEDESEEDITCTMVKSYCASLSTQAAWLKCLPSHPDDIEVGSAYIMLQVKVDAEYKITSVHAFTRFMDGMNGGFACGGFFIEMPGMGESMASHFNHMPMFPPEVLEELDMLVAGRYYKPGFSFIGKVFPSNLNYMNGCDGARTIAKASAFRNSYFHLSIYLNEDGLIESFEFSQYINEHSMFQRPQSSDEDIIDGLDCALMLLDAYTDEEYEQLSV